MRFIKVLTLSIFLLSSSAFADLGDACNGVNPSVWDNVREFADKRSQIQAGLNLRDNPELTAVFIENFIVLNERLGSYSSDDFLPVLALAAVCGQPGGQVPVQDFLNFYCPQISGEQTKVYTESILNAKAIVNLSDHIGPGDKPGVINKLENTPITSSFGTAIQNILDACGDKLKDKEDDDPEDPGICSASPFSQLTDFLWKPVSEKDGRLVVLTNPVASIDVDSEDLVDQGPSNGRCATARGARSGCGYGSNVPVAVTTAVEFYVLILPNGCNRYDCRGSLGNCGIKAYNYNELRKNNKKVKRLKKQIKKLKKVFKNTTGKKAKRKIRKRIKKTQKRFKKAKKINDYAKRQGARF